MDSFVAQYSGWGLILRITQSKFGLERSSQSGAQSTFSIAFTDGFNSNSQPFRRCEALPEDMATGVGTRRTHERTDFLVEEFDSKVAWDAFGIYDDVVVRDDMHERIQG
jgi:hypothetical protein